MTSMQMACKSIARAVKKAGIANLYGGADTNNASGDDVKKLDVLSNDIMCAALINSHTCAVLVSEEQASLLTKGVFVVVHMFSFLRTRPTTHSPLILTHCLRKSPLSSLKKSGVVFVWPSIRLMDPPTS